MKETTANLPRLFYVCLPNSDDPTGKNSVERDSLEERKTSRERDERSSTQVVEILSNGEMNKKAEKIAKQKMERNKNAPQIASWDVCFLPKHGKVVL